EAVRAAESSAKQLIDANDFAKAVALIEQSLAKYPGETVMESLLAKARERLAAQRRSEAIEAILQKARELIKANEYQTALNTVRSGIREYSDDTRLAALSSEIRAKILEMEKERAIRTALSSAAAFQEQGEFSKAAELLEHTLTKAPGQAAIQEALAVVK